MQIPRSNEDNEWWKAEEIPNKTKDNIQGLQQRFDINQIFSIYVGIDNDLPPLDLPQVEFTILQNWIQVSVVLTKESGGSPISTYSAILAYNGIMTETKRRELYQFLTKHFSHAMVSLVIQQPQKMASS